MFGMFFLRRATRLLLIGTRGGLSVRGWDAWAGRRWRRCRDRHARVTPAPPQSDAVRFVAQSPAALAALGDATLASLGLGRGGVAAVAAALPTVEALSFATSQGVSAVAVIGDSGVLVGSLSVSDLRACAGAGALASLALPVREFLAGQRLVTCAPDALLSAVVARLAAERVHRLWVVDSDGVPSGVVTLTDVLRVMCSE